MGVRNPVVQKQFPTKGGTSIVAFVEETSDEPGRLPGCLLEEPEPEPTLDSAARSSIDSGFGTEVVQTELDGLKAAGMSAEVSGIPVGSIVVESKWLLKRKGGKHGMVARAKAIRRGSVNRPRKINKTNTL